MDPLVARRAAPQVLLTLAYLICAACATTQGPADEGEPVYVGEDAAGPEAPAATTEKKDVEGEVPLVVAESEHPPKKIEEVIVEAPRDRHEVILGLVSEAQSILR